jgi:hypothetical protein
MAFVPIELQPVVGKSKNTLWTYENSAVDTTAAQQGADWFTGAVARGMKVGDSIISSTTAGAGTVLRCDSVSGDDATVT